MRKRGARSTEASASGGEQGFWPSYADMMSAVALILFFLMLLSYIQNMITGNSLRGTEAELNDTLQRLAATSAEVAAAQEELKVIFSDLETARSDLDAQQIHIDEQNAYIQEQEQTLANQKNTLAQQEQTLNEQESTLNEQKATLEEQAQFILQQQADINAQRELIAMQQAQAEQQKYYLTVTQAELETVRRQMQEVSVLRWEVIDQIRRNISQVMGNANAVSVNENGNLVLGESVLFGSGSYTLNSADYRVVLDQLADGFAAFLSNPENTKHVDSIVIAGHADVTGDPKNNRDLSAKRALAVLNYLLDANGGFLSKPEYAKFFSAAGYGSTRPAVDENTVSAYAQNRRIEISIVLKDDSVLDILNNYLEISIPETVG